MLRTYYHIKYVENHQADVVLVSLGLEFEILGESSCSGGRQRSALLLFKLVTALMQLYSISNVTTHRHWRFPRLNGLLGHKEGRSAERSDEALGPDSKDIGPRFGCTLLDDSKWPLTSPKAKTGLTDEVQKEEQSHDRDHPDVCRRVHVSPNRTDGDTRHCTNLSDHSSLRLGVNLRFEMGNLLDLRTPRSALVVFRVSWLLTCCVTIFSSA